MIKNTKQINHIFESLKYGLVIKNLDVFITCIFIMSCDLDQETKIIYRRAL